MQLTSVQMPYMIGSQVRSMTPMKMKFAIALVS
jgi:hypothetical protein